MHRLIMQALAHGAHSIVKELSEALRLAETNFYPPVMQ